MSDDKTFRTRLRVVAQTWRLGADNLRREYLTGSGVPPEPEGMATAMEACAQRLENEIGLEDDRVAKGP